MAIIAIVGGFGMKKNEAEEMFKKYREYLRQEVVRLASYAQVYRRLYKRRYDRLAEMNLAPAFFGIVTDALFTAIVLWVDKLLGRKSERGLLNFLTFCEHNRNIFNIIELQKRRNYPDGHWMLNREPITFQMIENDKELIKNLELLDSFKLRRDKFHAHFDKDYFFDRDKLSEQAPLKWSDLEKVVEVMKDIINKYSSAYDGNLYHVEPINVNDLDYLLDLLNKCKNK